MKEEWLMPGAVVPVDVETTAALVAEIKRLIGVAGDLALSRQLWIELTDDEMNECWGDPLTPLGMKHARAIESKLKEKNT